MRGTAQTEGCSRAGLDADDGAAKAVTAACGPGTDPDGEREHESEELFAGGERLSAAGPSSVMYVPNRADSRSSRSSRMPRGR